MPGELLADCRAQRAGAAPVDHAHRPHARLGRAVDVLAHGPAGGLGPLAPHIHLGGHGIERRAHLGDRAGGGRGRWCAIGRQA